MYTDTHNHYVAGKITETPNCCSLATLSNFYWKTTTSNYANKPGAGSPSEEAIAAFTKMVEDQFASIRNGMYAKTCTIQAVVVDKHDMWGLRDDGGYGAFFKAVGFVEAAKFRGSHGNDLILYMWYRGKPKEEG